MGIQIIVLSQYSLSFWLLLNILMPVLLAAWGSDELTLKIADTTVSLRKEEYNVS